MYRGCRQGMVAHGVITEPSVITDPSVITGPSVITRPCYYSGHAFTQAMPCFYSGHAFTQALFLDLLYSRGVIHAVLFTGFCYSRGVIHAVLLFLASYACFYARFPLVTHRYRHVTHFYT